MKTNFPLLTACCLLSVTGISSAGPLPDFPFITADGRATRDVPPTNAKVTFTVLVFSKTSEESTNTVQSTLAKVVTTLKEAGVNENQISAHDLDKSAVRKRTEDYKDLDILGYEVSRNIELTLSELGNYPKIIRAVMATDNVSKLASVFDISNRDEVEAELTGEACAKARKKAELLAKGARVSIGAVRSAPKASPTLVRSLESKIGLRSMASQQWIPLKRT